MANSGASRGNDRRISWSARLLAPLALVVALIAVAVVVTGSLAIDDGESESTPQVSSTTSAGDGDGDGAETPKEYAVESGDTLSSIAEEFDVSVKRLERLNKEQELDPNALVEGQVITIR